MLKNHSYFTPDPVDALEIVVQLNPVNDNLSCLMLFKPVDASDHCGFSRTGRPTHHNALPFADPEVNILQYMKLAVPFVHARYFNDRFIGFNCATA